MSLDIISIRKQPTIVDKAISYFQAKWPSVLPIIYEDAISSSIHSNKPLPQWYLLVNGELIIGCAGLITNDFISRGDLYPWLCALFIEEKYRGKGLAKLLIDQAIEDTKKGGFDSLYLCTEHIGYYEKHGFRYLAQGYHPWGEESRIYEISVI